MTVGAGMILKILPKMSPADEIDQIYDSLVGNGFPKVADTAVILGSGLGGFETRLSELLTIAYADIPGFLQTSVTGHTGTLSTGKVGSKRVLVFAGRFHHYEGYTFEQTTFPVRLAHAFGIHTLIATNASGGINTQYRVGDLMLIDDLLGFGCKFRNAPAPVWKRFESPDVRKALDIALKLKIRVQCGSYLYVKGPSYETKAEIRAFRRMGADAVGMSTLPELLEATRLDMASLGISVITNKATGSGQEKLVHDDIKEVAGKKKKDFIRLLQSLIERW